MASPSTSDLLWVIGLPFQQRWTVPVMRAAVSSEWPGAKQLARTQLGDESIARELMERAIEQTWEQIADLRSLTVEEARKHLRRHFKNALRREKRGTFRLRFWGLGSDLDVLAPPVSSQAAEVEAKLDVEAILRETSPEIRHALLTRHGARRQWGEIAKDSGKSADSIRIACQRELSRLREQLESRTQGTRRRTGRGEDGVEGER